MKEYMSSKVEVRLNCVTSLVPSVSRIWIVVCGREGSMLG